MRDFERRVRRLEAAQGFGEIRFRLRSGQRAGIRRKELLTAIGEAVDGVHSRRAMVLLNAERASDGNQLHTMVQAIAAGGVAPGGINE